MRGTDRMPQAQANGLTLDDEDLGPPEAPCVLLIMGLGMPAALWPDAFVDRLRAAGLRVIRFDNRDCGHSSKLRGGTSDAAAGCNRARAAAACRCGHPTRSTTWPTTAAALLSAIGVARAHVVGASMGGMIAQVLAARHPDRVLSLTSIMSSSGNPSPRIALGSRRALRAILHRPTRTDDVDALTTHLVQVFGVIGSPGYPSDPQVLHQQLDGSRSAAITRPAPHGSCWRSSPRATGARCSARIRVPTLVIHGADDPLVPLAAGIDTAKHIRGARLKVIPGMGHDFPAALQSGLATLISAHVANSTAGRDERAAA